MDRSCTSIQVSRGKAHSWAKKVDANTSHEYIARARTLNREDPPNLSFSKFPFRSALLRDKHKFNSSRIGFNMSDVFRRNQFVV